MLNKQLRLADNIGKGQMFRAAGKAGTLSADLERLVDASVGLCPSLNFEVYSKATDGGDNEVDHPQLSLELVGRQAPLVPAAVFSHSNDVDAGRNRPRSVAAPHLTLIIGGRV